MLEAAESGCFFVVSSLYRYIDNRINLCYTSFIIQQAETDERPQPGNISASLAREAREINPKQDTWQRDWLREQHAPLDR